MILEALFGAFVIGRVFSGADRAAQNAEAMRAMLLEHGAIDPLPEPEPAPAKQPSAFSAWLKRASNPYPDYLHKPVKEQA